MITLCCINFNVAKVLTVLVHCVMLNPKMLCVFPVRSSCLVNFYFTFLTLVLFRPFSCFKPIGETIEMECSSSAESEDSEQDMWNPEQSTGESMLLTQLQLNDLTQDLNLVQEFDQLLGSRLYESNLLAPRTTNFWYRHKNEVRRKYFRYDKDKSLVYYQNVLGLVSDLETVYFPVEWQLFQFICKEFEGSIAKQ